MIGYEKSELSYLFFDLDFSGHFWRGHHVCPQWYESSKPDQQVGPLGGSFGSTVILKPCFDEFPGPNPHTKIVEINGFLSQKYRKFFLIRYRRPI